MSGKRKRKTVGSNSVKKNQEKTTNVDLLQRALSWAVDQKIFAHLKLHGNTTWAASQLVILAVLWVWSDKNTLTGAFDQARQLALQMFGTVALTTYQGLTNALVTWSGRLIPVVWLQLHARMEEAGGPYWRIGKWLPLAVDGSRATTPRTVSNERAFSAKHFGKGRKAKSRSKWKNKKKRSKSLSEPVKPQIWLTLLWHMGLKMPWCWKTGPSTSSERGHFQELLGELKFVQNTLFCGDAGFVGYELWKTILDAGHSFLIRVGGNVRLLRNLGHIRHRRGLVYLWPNEVARRNGRPIVLRLIQFSSARGTVYLVTNVLSQSELCDRQAMQLYRLRWGVELQFRSFKQTFGRGKLRSRTSSRALVELEWSLVGLWIIQLYAVREQIKVGSPPARSSVALALSVIHDAMREWTREVSNPRELSRRLSAAVKDDYRRRRSKRARYEPNYKDKPSATKPMIVEASAKQRKAYRAMSAAA